MKFAFPKIKTHRFRDTVFKIFWCRYRRAADEEPGSNLGYCDHRESPGRKAHIYPGPNAFTLLMTTIHESVHACFSDIDNGAVQEFEDDLAKLFRRMKLKVSFEGQDDGR